MNEEQIKRMVDRFLSWKLPEAFNPDGGISFAKTINTGTPYEMKNEPSGTNLLSAAQAEAMVRYLVKDMETCVSGMRLPGESLPKIHPDYATDGLTEPLKPLVRETVEERDASEQ